MAFRGLVVAGGDAAGVFEAIEATLDAIAQSVDEAVDRDLRDLDEAIALHRDDRLGASRSEVLADGVAVVALVGDQDPRGRATFIRDRLVALGVGGLAGGQDEGDGQAEAVGTEVDLGREATTRTADIVVRRA
ncbi:hypothetical protein GGQ63_000674 [Prosthecomicrobium pneumaticum]|uniref:Uncharacterized protein n=1 Tax=Prosthecomicrobium pneumaticum TaxID=81895 RepID=A0A7W9FJI8_9HYPH|nr:hypothetical protein [Prosthecomicrobium pneumaticum]